ncbi:GrpB family protein [Desertihabitans aurantiacus]|uniref:GrpB family protein n=1 Tax=Desertihabitans aurantiacus TaxID=2282477 RepID=UPI000DF79A28|nr:GrpB family protein [Desertihabitans aurantiacus]
MPFEDELGDGVTVHPYRPSWATEAADLATTLSRAVRSAVAVEHIGSTAVAGMSAKDVLDMMVVVPDPTASDVEHDLTWLGYRRRPEPWNNSEPAAGRHWPKMTFAPPVGGRAQNIHVRAVGSPTLRLALLFRDHLRASPQRTAWWSELKTAAAAVAPDLAAYGRLKYPAWCLLMELAETWARDTGWRPPDHGLLAGDDV